MVIMTSKQTKPRAENDFYPTPIKLATDIVWEYANGFNGMTVLDPGCGDGSFGYAINFVLEDNVSRIDGVDIVERKLQEEELNPYKKIYYEDFLTFKNKIDYDLVIGNPPYSLAEEFVRKSIDCLDDGGRILFLMKLAFLESKKRTRGLFKELPPSHVHVLAGRPSFDGTGRTNDYAFAVFEWNKGYHGKTVLDWFDWN